MHLAILMTNTDESAFAQRHPRDGEKFTDLVRRVRPGWTTEVFPVKDGVFPETLEHFDGAMITGSPASVNSGAEWTARLFDLVRELHSGAFPVFGACFGHQAVAVALGGRVGPSPGGWVHGLTRNEILVRRDWMRDLPEVVNLYASHAEQVLDPPAEADILARSEGCPISGMAIGRHIYTTQHHPEMTHDFILALTEEMAGILGPDLTTHALTTLQERPDMDAFAESVAKFFEQARDES